MSPSNSETIVNLSVIPDQWLGLVIGNSRLHWSYFQRDTLIKTWDSPHLQNHLPLGQFLATIREIIAPFNQQDQRNNLIFPLYLASVVPSQTLFWQNYANLHIITLDNLPLTGLYPTLGIDRALAVLGAGCKYSFPCLVIDAGTALTVTGVNGDRRLRGGVIIPGLGLQLKTLRSQTAALPAVSLPANLPPRWSLSTPEAITSGVIYTILAGVKDFIQQWWQEFPNSKVLITGGDGEHLLTYLQDYCPQIASQLIRDSELIFKGMSSLLWN